MSRFSHSVQSRLDENDWHAVRINLKDIVKDSFAGKEVVVPDAFKHKLPNWVGNVKTLDRNGKETNIHSSPHGTAIIIESPDRLSAGYVRPSKFIDNLKKEIGLTYRHYLETAKISIVEYDTRKNKYGR